MGHIVSPFCGCNDCDGERGKRGKRGKRGHDGERGERGERGPRGHRGDDGSDGFTGPTGETGATGPTGPGIELVESAWALKWSGRVVQGADPITQSLADPGTDYAPTDFARNRYPFCAPHVATCIAIRTADEAALTFGNATVRVLRDGAIVAAVPAPASGTTLTIDFLPPIVFAAGQDIEVEVALPGSPITPGGEIRLTVVVEFEGPRGATGATGPSDGLTGATGATGPTGATGATGPSTVAASFLKFSGAVIGSAGAQITYYLPDSGNAGQVLNSFSTLFQRLDYPMSEATTLSSFAAYITTTTPPDGLIRFRLLLNDAPVSTITFNPGEGAPTPKFVNFPNLIVAPGDFVTVELILDNIDTPPASPFIASATIGLV